MSIYEYLTTSRYYLELLIDGSNYFVDGYFMECQGFKRSLDVIEICEVTPQKWGSANSPTGRVVRTKIPGNSKSENITLKQGMSISTTMWDWLNDVEAGNWSTQRYDADLIVYNQGGWENCRFRLQGAWPVSYKISDPSAGGTDFQVEEVELACDDFTRVTSAFQTGMAVVGNIAGSI